MGPSPLYDDNLLKQWNDYNGLRTDCDPGSSRVPIVFGDASQYVRTDLRFHVTSCRFPRSLLLRQVLSQDCAVGRPGYLRLGGPHSYDYSLQWVVLASASRIVPDGLCLLTLPQLSNHYREQMVC